VDVLNHRLTFQHWIDVLSTTAALAAKIIAKSLQAMRSTLCFLG
jgi:hypothetical protein